MKTLLFHTPPFPTFITGGTWTFQAGKKHVRRTYPVFDCLYVQQGTLYMGEEDTEYEVKEGEYVILMPGREHFGYKACAGQTDYYWFHFRAEIASFVMRNEQLQWTDVLIREETYTEPAAFLLQLPQHGKVQNREMAKRQLDELVRVTDFISVEDRLKRQLLFYQFLLFLQKEALAIPSAAEKVSEQTVAYIRQHYKDSVKIVDIADILHYHVDYITRCMQKTMGISPLQYVTEVRMSEAKKLLAVTNEKVKTIAQEVGFQDEAYFSRLFRKKEGMSPQVYRRMMQREGKKE